VALEATGPANAIAGIIEPHVARVVVANTRRVRAIAEARVKSDKVDASTLRRVRRLAPARTVASSRTPNMSRSLVWIHSQAGTRSRAVQRQPGRPGRAGRQAVTPLLVSDRPRRAGIPPPARRADRRGRVDPYVAM
jgi:hypothetical protein